MDQNQSAAVSAFSISAGWKRARFGCHRRVIDFDNSGFMDKIEIVDSLAALAHPTRLAVLEHLLNCGAAGRSAGDLGRALKIPQSTMSAHLTVLNVARLTSRTRRSRSIIYRVEPATLLHLLSFLIGMSAAHPDVREGLKKVEGVLSQASPQN